MFIVGKPLLVGGHLRTLAQPGRGAATITTVQPISGGSLSGWAFLRALREKRAAAAVCFADCWPLV
jgi:hypothetical protein